MTDLPSSLRTLLDNQLEWQLIAFGNGAFALDRQVSPSIEYMKSSVIFKSPCGQSFKLVPTLFGWQLFLANSPLSDSSTPT